MKAPYLKALEQLELGLTREAEQVIELWRAENELDPSTERELLRRLLNTRLHYKQNKSLPNGEQFLNENFTKDDFIKAEVLFVKGLNAFHQEDFKTGADHFKKSAELYPFEKFAAKSLLASYNEYIGLLNADLLDEAQEENQLSYLERIAYRIESEKMLGMILRQKSYLLERRGHFASALDAAVSGLEALKKTAPISDYQLMLLQQCDLLVSLKRIDEAATLFHGLLGPFENRVLFAHAFVKSRVTNQLPPQPREFAIVPPVWRIKLSRNHTTAVSMSSSLTTIVWKASQGILITAEGNEISIKRDSIEGKILSLLASGRKDRAALCAALWPDDVDTELLQDRLKKSLRRLKNKHPNMVVFNHGYYSLGFTLKIA
jgi:hypothetical protein